MRRKKERKRQGGREGATNVRNPHTSGTRKRSEQVVQFFGTVKRAREERKREREKESRRGLQFLLALSRTLIARSDPAPFLVAPRSQRHLHRRNARAIITRPESFADRSRVRAQTTFSLSFPLFPLSLVLRPFTKPSPIPCTFAPFARNLSHSSSSPRFVKSYAPTFIA